MLFLIRLFVMAPVVTKSTLTPRISVSSFSNLIRVNKEGEFLNSMRISISLPSLFSPLVKILNTNLNRIIFLQVVEDNILNY